ncbi:hypothetical protein SEA_JEHOSHAPHAT_14 [Microbacterium phage Jehoshaphat]|nr:hypothetical protein SEA_TEEHEE_14 [Microbacterium phage Teehee]QXN73407.1 hypothetical protein SEA_JEHOSHAPHAT_14 [Microbacterium phage Jehoshaphat]QXN73937.1 hypothetical protein SEA_BLAB_10 [Microbacterium phage Blab]
MTDQQPRLTARGRHLVDSFDDLTAYDGDVGDAFRSLGVSYDAFRKMLARAGRIDLLSKLTAWRIADNEQLQRALGRQWQA